MWSKLDVIVLPRATAGADTQSKVPDSATPALVRRLVEGPDASGEHYASAGRWQTLARANEDHLLNPLG